MSSRTSSSGEVPERDISDDPHHVDIRQIAIEAFSQYLHQVGTFSKDSDVEGLGGALSQAFDAVYQKYDFVPRGARQ